MCHTLQIAVPARRERQITAHVFTVRIPVYTVGSNPETDQWLCKKSEGYVCEEVAAHRAVWINDSNHAKGCIVRRHYNLRAEADFEKTVAGSGFDTAWTIKQSGYAGPNVWQLKTSRSGLDRAGI